MSTYLPRRKRSKSQLTRRSRIESLESRQLLATFADAGFESPVQPDNNWEQANGTGGGDLTGSAWTFSPSAGITRNISPFQNGNVAAPEGSQFALIQGPGSIEQTGADFIPGNTYQITVSTAARNGTTGNDLILEIDGQPIVGGRVQFTSFSDVVSGFFVADTATPTLTIRATNPSGGDRTTFIDNVRITDLGVITTPTIANPSFEDFVDPTPFPGYDVVPGWASDTISSGNNGTSGNTPFLNGLPVPDGNRVGFIQRVGTFSTVAAGLTPGSNYRVIYSENERGTGVQLAQTSVSVDGNVVVPQHDVVRTAEFIRVGSSVFTAASDSALISFSSHNNGGDNTALFDDIQIVEVNDEYFIDKGFELPGQPINQWEQANGTGGGSIATSHWSFSPTAGITHNVSPFQSNGAVAPEGEQFALIQREGSISQTGFGFVPGDAYQLTISAAARDRNPTGNNLLVSIDGQLVLGGGVYSPTFDDFTSMIFFPATATPTITIEATNPTGGDATTFIDNLRITPVATPTVPTIINPSFEDDTLGVFPQYQPVDGFASDNFKSGVNDAGGPFVNGAVIPDGNQAAFIQHLPGIGVNYLEQTITGLTPGESYAIQYFENARNAVTARPALMVDGVEIVAEHDATHTDRFRRVISAPFVATGTTATLRLVNGVGADNDHTALFDNLSIIEPVPVVPEGGFETPQQPANNWEQANGVGGGSLAGSQWMYTAGAGITRNISPFQNGGIPAPEGSQHGLLQGTGASIDQSAMIFTPGESYTLTLSTMARQSGAGGNDLEVVLDAGLPTEVVLIDMPEVTFNAFTDVTSIGFTATKDTYSITIRANLDDGTLTGDRTTFVDDLRFDNTNPPTVGDDSYSTDEETPLNNPAPNLLANDSDADGDSFTVTEFNGSGSLSGMTAAGASVTLRSDGTFDYDPSGSASLQTLSVGSMFTDTFTYTVTDDTTLPATGTVSVVVNGVNDVPTVTVANATVTVDEGQSAANSGSFADIDSNDTVTITASIGTITQDAGNSGNWSWSWPTDDGPDDSATVTITADDGQGGTDSVMFDLTVDNVDPVVSITGQTEAALDVPVPFTFTATDVSAADQAADFTFDIDWGDGSAVETIVGTSPITPTHSFQSFGEVTVSVTATDKDGGVSDPVEHTITIVPVAIVGNDLVATGTDASDTIIVYSTGLGVQVRYNNIYYPLGGGGYSFSGQMIVNGRGGSDRIIASGGFLIDANFDGGEGNDYLAGGLGDDTFSGGAGNDVLLASEGDNVLDGGDGSDRMEGRSGADLLFGGAGNDRLNGGAGDDILDGGTDNDFLFGGLGNDLLFGDLGIDTIDGHSGNDVIFGGGDADQLFGRSDHDILIGGLGGDRVRGDGGDDTLIGGVSALEAQLEADLDLMQATAGGSLSAGVRAAVDAWFASPTAASRSLFEPLTDDGSIDDLTGGSGADTYVQGANDRFRNYRDSEDTTV